MRSIQVRTNLYFLTLITFISLILIFCMNFFISGRYYNDKVKRMTTVVQRIDRMYQISDTEKEALMAIEYLGYNFQGKITILDEDTNQVLYENKHYTYTQGTFLKEIKVGGKIAYVYETSYPVEGSRWLIYIEKLQNNKIAFLQIPIVAIDEALSFVRRFTNLILLFTTIVAMILSFFLAKSISEPVRKLEKVAESIKNLEFDIKYDGHREDELGQLGFKLNQISDTLKSTIFNLNYELEKEKSIDKMRRRFVAQVSHELKTPIAIISSYVDALIDGIVEEEEMANYYEVLEDECLKMSKIIKDLLQLSQLESDTFSFKMEAFNIITYIESIMSKNKILAQNKNLEFKYLKNIGREVEYTFYGDPLRIEQGITNIISNALKHAKSKIIITSRIENNKLKLLFYNDGINIKQKDIEHIFESFYKGETSRNKEGSGLGLTISSKIFDKHGIEYRITNVENGVEFELLF